MSGPFNSPIQRRRPVINIASLIDVMFLLLIFFMVSATFRDQPGMDLTLPGAETAEGGEAPSYTVTVDREGRIFVGEDAVDEEGLRESISALLAEDPEAQFTLRADETADFGRVIRVVDIARSVGGRRVIIPTRPLERLQDEPAG